MSDEQIQDIKIQVEKFKQSRTDVRGRYPQNIRDAAKEFHRQGLSISQISNCIGVTYDAVQNWVAPKAAPKFKEVKIKTTAPKENVEKLSVFHIVISKNGFDVKIENSSPDMMLKILKGL